MPLRICAIDVGTHSTRSLTCDVREDGRWEEVDRGLRVTAMGKGLAREGRIRPEAALRAADAIGEFARRARIKGAARILAQGTMALRSASNSAEIIAIMEERAGLPVSIISGREEAELTYSGAAKALGKEEDEITIVDVGGGSTEVVWRSGGAGPRPVSFDTGCLTLTDRFLSSDPPSPEERERMEESISLSLAEALPLPRHIPSELVGAGGTITTAAAIELRMAEYDGARVHGMRMDLEKIAATYRRLAGMPLAERENVTGLMKERAPVIVAGLAVVKGLMEYLGAGRITVSDYGILLGTIMKAFRDEGFPV